MAATVERLLVNFFYAHPVGHAIEALHYADGYHAADPELEIAVALNAATAVELASFCPFVSAAYAIEQPLLEPRPASLAGVPREWTWVVDDGRRHQDIQLQLFPGLRDYYAASDRHLIAGRGRGVAGAPPPAYVPHHPLRLRLPDAARAAAAARLGAHDTAIAVMPAGSSERALYPSLRSWLLILDALADALPGVRIALVGKRRRRRPDVDVVRRRRARGAARPPVAPGRLLRRRPARATRGRGRVRRVPRPAHRLRPRRARGRDAVARAVGRALVRVLLQPCSVPLGDPGHGALSRASASSTRAELSAGEDGPRTPSMTERRVREDLDRIVGAARELVAGSVPYEQCLRDYFAALLAAHDGDASAIWSIDGVHAAYANQGRAAQGGCERLGSRPGPSGSSGGPPRHAERRARHGAR